MIYHVKVFPSWAILILVLMAFIAILQSTMRANERRNSPQQKNIRAAITEGFQLSLQAEKSTVGIGDAIILKLDLKNASQQTLSVKDQATRYDYEVDVRDEPGKKVALTEKGKQQEELRAKWQEIGARFSKINPEESLKYTLDIAGLYQIKPGSTYFITVSRKVGKRDGQGTATVTSNTIEIMTIA